MSKEASHLESGWLLGGGLGWGSVPRTSLHSRNRSNVTIRETARNCQSTDVLNLYMSSHGMGSLLHKKKLVVSRRQPGKAFLRCII